MGEEQDFGSLLRRFRRDAGLSQEALAERAGLTTQAISALERGLRRSPQRETVRALGDALGLAPAERGAFESIVVRRRGPAPSRVETSLSPAPQRADLPVPPDTLVGRDEAVAALVAALAGGERLITLIGPGGVGKTSLALVVARLLAQSANRAVCFVPLAPLRDHSLIASAVAEALGLGEPSAAGWAKAVCDHLSGRSQLLVLDNFEHLLPSTALVTELLAACPHLAILATSRAPLHLRGERPYVVPPLATPALGEIPALEILARYPAVALFVRQARVVAPEFALRPANAAAVAAICRRLDGLPLALELAAARVRLLTPAVLLTRLASALPLLTGGARDLPERQQTLRATLAWSYDLLHPNEQALFRRLAVCAGGCTLAAATAVCGTGEPLAVALLDWLGALLDQSLVQRTVRSGEPEAEPRFTMLETVREYGLECLAASDEGDATRRRHAAYYLALAEEAEPHLTGAEQAAWLLRLAQEHDNLRAALGWAVANGAAALGVRLAGALWRFWYARGYHSEARGWLAAVLALPDTSADPVPPAARAKALHGAGGLAYTQGDYGTARALQQESLALRRALGDRRGSAALVDNLGLIAREQGDYRGALALHRESLALRRTLGDPWGIAASLNNLGTVHGSLGDYASAAACYAESLEAKRTLGDRGAIALTLMNLGEAVQHLGDYARAIALTEESLALFRALGDDWGAAYALLNLGSAALDRGDPALAAAHLEACLTLRRPLGAKADLAFALTHLGEAARQLGDPARARALHEEGLALAGELNHAWLHALVRAHLGALARDQGDRAGTEAHYSDSLARFRQLGSVWGIAFALNGLAGATRANGDLVQAAACYDEALERCGEIGDRLQAAVAFEGLAGLAMERGEAAAAARLGGAAAALRAALGTPLTPAERAAFDALMALARDTLGDVPFTVACDEGRTRSLTDTTPRHRI